jgi:hypothetical protein
VPIDGTIDSLKGMMLDNKYLYEKCREDGLAPGSLVQPKINHTSNNGNYAQKDFKVKKVKLSLCITKHHTIKMYWESGSIA